MSRRRAQKAYQPLSARFRLQASLALLALDALL